jgi:uncharacterized surface protein with fasciclin (FAS1) repeats
MSLKHLTALVAASVLTSVPLLAVPAASASAGEPAGHRSLAKVLAGDGHHFDSRWGDFDIVDKAVRTVLAEKPKSPVATLAKGRTAVTAFLPTDRAFRHLVKDLTGDRKHTERGVFRALAGAADVDTLESVLLYHVVPGATVTYRQALRSDGAELQTALDGGTIEVNVTERHRVRLRDADRNDENARVVRSLRNINKGNKQIAHGIHRVLRPADL